MARARSHKSSNPIANDPLLDLATPKVSPSPLLGLDFYRDLYYDRLDEVEDLRRYHPQGDARPLQSRSGARARMALDPMRSLRAPPRITTYNIFRSLRPDVLICARRKIRKEVLHALGLKRRGKGGGKRRSNWRSKIKC